MEKALQRWISGTSFLSTILVVVLHFSTFSKITDDRFFSKAILYCSHGIATAAVPTFFFLSGYLLFRNVENTAALRAKLQKRTKSLLLPYIAWNICYMAVMIAGSLYKRGIGGSDISLKNVLYGVFLHKYVFNMWFLLVLIINTFIISFFVLYLKKVKTVSLLVAVALIVTSFFVKGTFCFPDKSVILFSLEYFVYWLAGCLCTDQQIERCFHFLRRRKVCVAVISLAVILLLAYPTMLAKNDIAFVELESLLVFLLTVAFLALTMAVADRLPVTKENMGMMIYGAHGFFAIAVAGAGLAIKDYIGNGALTFILYVASISATVVIIYFAGVCMKRYLPPLYKILAGGR